MYCDTPIATTATIAVYSSSRSHPMNHRQPRRGPRTRMCRRTRPAGSAPELRIGQGRAGAGETGDEEGDGHRQAGVGLGHWAGGGEDAGTDDRAEPDGGELPQPDAAFERPVIAAANGLASE